MALMAARMPRYAARTDRNHTEVVTALRRAGASVVDLSKVGGGVPDLLVGMNGRTWLLEVKSTDGRLMGVQSLFHLLWSGCAIRVVRSVEEAVRILHAGDEVAGT